MSMLWVSLQIRDLSVPLKKPKTKAEGRKYQRKEYKSNAVGSMMEKISETRSWCFEKISKPLVWSRKEENLLAGIEKVHGHKSCRHKPAVQLVTPGLLTWCGQPEFAIPSPLCIPSPLLPGLWTLTSCCTHLLVLATLCSHSLFCLGRIRLSSAVWEHRVGMRRESRGLLASLPQHRLGQTPWKTQLSSRWSCKEVGNLNSPVSILEIEFEI